MSQGIAKKHDLIPRRLQPLELRQQWVKTPLEGVGAHLARGFTIKNINFQYSLQWI